MGKKISLLFMITLFFLNVLSGQHYFFERYLQDTTVFDIVMDSDGILWIGTESGLYRYDSKNFTHYVFDPTDSTSISNNSVRSLFIDSEKRLWVGTRSGLNLYDASKDIFIRQYSEDQKNQPLNGIFVNSIGENKEGIIWFANDADDFWQLHTHNNTFKKTEKIRNPQQNSNSDPDKILATVDSLIPSNNFQQTITSTLIDKNNNYYLGMINGMVYKMPFEEGIHSEMLCLTREMDDFGAIRMIFKDDRSNLWIGSEKGLYVSYKHDIQFNILKAKGSDDSWKGVNSITRDRNDRLWIALKREIMIQDEDTLFKGKDIYPSLKYINTYVYNLYQDSNKDIWTGTFGKGLYHFNPVSGKLQHYLLHEYVKNSGKEIDKIWNITEDHDGNLWIATWGGGLVFYDRKVQKFSNFRSIVNDPFSISSNKIISLLFDSTGILWIGTDGGGLNSFDPKTQKFHRHNISFYHDMPVQDRSILCLYEDSKGMIWAGSDGGGLFRYDRTENNFLIYNDLHGLKNQSVKMILEDADTNLWISTNGGGIFKFDRSQGNFYQFTVEDGISSNRFQNGSGFRDSSGSLYFGSAQGITFFDPDSVKTSEYQPLLFVQELLLNNKRKDNNGILYREHLKKEGKIRLKPSDRIFQMEFASVDYSKTDRNYYRYRIKGLNDHWVDIDGKPKITLMNMPPGKYTLEIQFTNNDGIWMNSTQRFSLQVLPPFYKTPFFLGIVLSLIGIILYLLHRYNVKSILKRRQELEEEVLLRTEKILKQQKKLEKQNQILLAQKNELTVRNEKIIESSERIRLMTKKLHESDVMKIKFFTHISHEIRTPLTLIIAPLDQLIAEYSDKNSAENSQYLSYLYTMRNNASKILKLFDQIITFRKLESGSLKIKKQKVYLPGFVKSIIGCFEDYARIMNIHLKLSDQTKGLSVHLDPEKMEMVFNNLLTNALKYTDKNGQIEVEIRETTIGTHPANLHHEPATPMVEMSVKDTGIGILPESAHKIFETYYQEDDASLKKSETGFGLGLSITKSIVEMHGGKIKVESEKGKGANFRIILPFQKNDECLKNGDPLSATGLSHRSLPGITADKRQTLDNSQPIEVENDKNNHPGRKLARSRKTILIVEDNFELRRYLVNYLSNTFHILEAENGFEGFELAQKHHPDIVVSDVIMPHTDGFEFLEKIKNNTETSHIPVIMLTAKVDVADKIKGMKLLADAYLAKPFHIHHLNAVIESVTENRLKVQKKYRSVFALNSLDIPIVSPDDKFIKKTKQVIEKNISNPDFNVHHLSAEVGVSRAGMYRKVKSLMNISVNSLIKHIRIKRAAQILSQKKLYVSEVAFEVGFNDVSYFRKCFRDIYKMTPSDYVAKQKREGLPKEKENIDLLID